jgi:hypothetical protein
MTNRGTQIMQTEKTRFEVEAFFFVTFTLKNRIASRLVIVASGITFIYST